MRTGSCALMAFWPDVGRPRTLEMKLAWPRATSARSTTRPASMLARSLARTSACSDTLEVSTRESTPERISTTVTRRMAAAAAIRVASDRRAASHSDRPIPPPPRNRRRLPNDSTSLRSAISATTSSPREARSAVRGHRAVTPRQPTARKTTDASRRSESQASCWSRPPWMRAAPASNVAAPERTVRHKAGDAEQVGPQDEDQEEAGGGQEDDEIGRKGDDRGGGAHPPICSSSSYAKARRWPPVVSRD